MEKIQAQFAKFWQLVSSPDTFGVYRSAVLTTWTILKEAALSLWLVVCLVLVVFEWFWRISVGTGRSARQWLNQLEGSSDQIASETGKALLSAGKSSLSYTLNQAKAQLGFEAEPVTVTPAKVEPVKLPTPVAASVKTESTES